MTQNGYSDIFFYLTTKMPGYSDTRLIVTLLTVPVHCKRGSLYSTTGASHFFEPSFRASPPYYSVLLYSLDFAAYAIPLVGKMFYAFKIAPPDLIATTIAVSGVFLWTAGKGAGSFVGGQLTEVLEITEVFFCASVFGVVAASCIMAVKTAFGGKWERKVLDEKETVMRQMSSISGNLEDVKVHGDGRETEKGAQTTRF